MMKTCLILVALSVAAHAQVIVPADTPEVAYAKYQHALEWHKAAVRSNPYLRDSASRSAPDLSNYYANYYANYYRTHPSSGAAPVTVLPSGFLADTPEVAAAKAAHFNDVAAARSFAPQAGPVTVLPSGFIADTPEVAAAKAAHFAAHANARGGIF